MDYDDDGSVFPSAVRWMPFGPNMLGWNSRAKSTNATIRSPVQKTPQRSIARSRSS